MRRALGFLMRRRLLEVVKVGELRRRKSSAVCLGMMRVCVSYCTVKFMDLGLNLFVMVHIHNIIGQPLEDIAEDEEPMEEEEDAEIGDDDDMADFIVDEEEVDENGAPVRYSGNSVYYYNVYVTELLYQCFFLFLRRRKFKRKKSRQAPGVSSSALQEAHEIFGDVDDLLQLRKQSLESTDLRERKLEDEFEPVILSEKYMTEKDDVIRERDVPERKQVYTSSTKFFYLLQCTCLLIGPFMVIPLF